MKDFWDVWQNSLQWCSEGGMFGLSCISVMLIQKQVIRNRPEMVDKPISGVFLFT